MLRRAGAYRLQHRRQDLLAVLEVGDAVAVDDRRPEQDADLAAELRVLDAPAMLQATLDTLLAGREVQGEQQGGGREQGPGDRGDEHACASAPHLASVTVTGAQRSRRPGARGARPVRRH
jgi:hypothetical protein